MSDIKFESGNVFTNTTIGDNNDVTINHGMAFDFKNVNNVDELISILEECSKKLSHDLNELKKSQKSNEISMMRNLLNNTLTFLKDFGANLTAIEISNLLH